MRYDIATGTQQLLADGETDALGASGNQRAFAKEFAHTEKKKGETVERRNNPENGWLIVG
jgi:hypothetical protein